VKRILLFTAVLITAAVQLLAAAAECKAQQTADATRLESVIGAVVEINQTAKSVTIKTDAGVVVTLKADDNTVCLRIPAGEKTLARAAAIQFTDIAVGDRVLGHGSRTNQEFLARRLVVMPKAEIERKRERELDEWRKRGISGIVRELNAQTGEINLELRSAGAGGRVMITTARSQFRRYASGSLRFEDAQPGTFAEVKVGDQLRALGDKSADGRTFAAEAIVSGAFKTVGATVTEVDVQRGEIKATTLEQKKPIIISITRDSALHRIPPPLAVAIAQRSLAGRPAAAPPAQTNAAQKAPAAQPVVDVQQAIDALPALSLADIKAGDVFAVTSAIEKDDSHLTAIKLVAGVNLVLKAMVPQPGRPQVVRLSAGLPAVFDFSVVPIN
jgi:hypothetical protein